MKPTLIACATALLISASNLYFEDYHARADRQERLYEFLLLHPDIYKDKPTKYATPTPEPKDIIL